MQPIQLLKPCNCCIFVILGALVKESGQVNSVMKMNHGMTTEVLKTNLDTNLRVMATGGWLIQTGRLTTTRCMSAKSSPSTGHNSPSTVNGEV